MVAMPCDMSILNYFSSSSRSSSPQLSIPHCSVSNDGYSETLSQSDTASDSHDEIEAGPGALWRPPPRAPPGDIESSTSRGSSSSSSVSNLADLLYLYQSIHRLETLGYVKVHINQFL